MTRSPATAKTGRHETERIRAILTHLILALAASASPGTMAAPAMKVAPAFVCPNPPASPPQAREIEVNGARLLYYDTGGSGPPVVLMHAHTGSARSWAYQIPALAHAGLRVIAYSRRGHLGSSSAENDAPGRSAQDLLALTEALHINRFHLVGTAAGGFLALDFALRHQERLLSLTLASSHASVDEPAFAATVASLTPPPFSSLPPQLRELGPSYRAVCQQGVGNWLQDESESKMPDTRLAMKAGTTDWAGIEGLKLRVLLMTGEADLYMPPSQMAVLKAHFRHAQLVPLPSVGHAAYWEQPDRFNRTLIDFLTHAPSSPP